MAVRLMAKRRLASSSNFLGIGLILSAIVVTAAIIIQAKKTPTIVEKIEPVVVGGYDYVTFPVPAKLVPVGTRVKDIPVKTASLPKHQVPDGAIISLSNYMEAVTVAPLPANLPFFPDNLSFTQSGNPVVERIPEGMRAMAIQVDATSAVEGWAGSGASVDILLVSKERTTVIAEKVRILSAERSVQPVQNQGTMSVPRTITILVTQDQCLAINTAIPRGKIALALRSANDEGPWKDTNFSAERLIAFSSKPVQKAPSVNGVVKFSQNQTDKAYVLNDGKWVPSDSLPDGYLLSEPRALNSKGE